MDVVLCIYDISKGLARQLSFAITGTQIDAIYHTSLVFGGVEYFFGRGVQQAAPGTTHHGEPIERIHMGTSQLPIEVIVEYMESLAAVYTEDSYDLFLRNCNNFTHDLSTFLVGKGIPDHIRNLPETFLSTPFGQMMRPYIDGMLRGATQGPERPHPVAAIQPPTVGANGATRPIAGYPKPSHPVQEGYVRNATTSREVEELLASANSSCAVIFFTSAKCPPCKVMYPVYDELAEEAGDKAILIKVDISRAFDVSTKYGIRATPTFMTFLKGKKENEWSGANEGELRGNVRLLIDMAWPPHPHRRLRLPNLERPVGSYVLYKKTPPLDKLTQKLGSAGDEPSLQDLVKFIKSRDSGGPAVPALPNLSLLQDFIKSKFLSLPQGVHFAVIDLVRAAFSDPRVSGFFAEEDAHHSLLTLLGGTSDLSNYPYSQQLVMTQLACNLFTSPLYLDQIVSHSILREACIKIATFSLLAQHVSLRAAGASFMYNLAAFNHNERLGNAPDRLSEADQVELVASVLEAIRMETESVESLHGHLLSLGLFVHLAPIDGEVLDLCRVMEAQGIVKEKEKVSALAEEPLLKEIGELLGNGLITR
ncbi:thioredoxin [Histoplasma ohiense]|nr:thioredoxin [Histoplasma ohiense (nom. inval.)]